MPMINTQAVHTLASHLRAHGHAVAVQGDHVIITRDDCQIAVEPSPEECVALRSADSGKALLAVNAALARVGVDAIGSIIYRTAASRRARLDDNFEDIVLRSKMLARCPNPEPGVFKQFEPMARRTAGRVFLRFRLPLKAFGYDREDLESVAMVHLITAIHRYRVGDEERDTMVLGRYVKQRLMEVVRKVQRKSLRCSSDTRTRSFTDLQFFLDTGAQNAGD